MGSCRSCRIFFLRDTFVQCLYLHMKILACSRDTVDVDDRKGETHWYFVQLVRIVTQNFYVLQIEETTEEIPSCHQNLRADFNKFRAQNGIKPQNEPRKIIIIELLFKTKYIYYLNNLCQALAYIRYAYRKFLILIAII